jgi:MFS family permease
MQASLLLSGAILLVVPLARGVVAIGAIVVVWAVTAEALRPASMAVVGDLVPPEQRKTAFALSRLAINLGMSVGPVVGGLLAMVSFPLLFVVDGTTSLLAGLLLAVFAPRMHRRASASREVHAGGQAGSLRGFADRRLLWFLAGVVLIALVFFQHMAAMPLFLVRDLRFSEALYGTLFAVNTILIIILEVPLNAAMAAWPHGRSLLLGSLLCAVGFGSMAFAATPWAVACTIVIWTFGEMVLFPGMAAYVADIAPLDRRGEYKGLYTMAFSFAITIGPWLGTEVLERLGSTTLWTACFLCGAVAAAMLLRVAEPPAKPPAEPATTPASG